MADSKDIQRALGIPLAMSDQVNDSVISFLGTPSSEFDLDKINAYVALSNDTFNRLNADNSGTEKSKDPFKYNDKQIFKYIDSSYIKDAQSSIENLREFVGKQDESFLAFDIETMGDTNGDDFSVTEVSMNEYDKRGKLVNTRLNMTIKPSDSTLSSLRDTVAKIEKDPKYINALGGAEKRAVVDLMRYSKIKEEGILPFTQSADGDKHNTIVEERLTSNNELVYEKFFEDPLNNTKHMKSGLNTLSDDVKLTQEAAAKKVSEYIKKQNDAGKIFVSFNGETFDIPTLSKFMEHNKVDLAVPDKSLDLYSAMQTIYQDPNRAMVGLVKGALNESYQYESILSERLEGAPVEKHETIKSDFAEEFFGTRNFESIKHMTDTTSDLSKKMKDVPDMKNWKLQDFGNQVTEQMAMLYGGQNMAHNATADTNLTAYIMSLMSNDMNEVVSKNRKSVKKAVEQKYNGEISFSDSPLVVDDKVIVKSAYRAADEERSFKAIYDQENDGYKIHEYGNGQLVTEGQGAEYIFKGVTEHEIDGEKHLVMELLQPDTNDRSFITRKGPNAMKELTNMFHKNFQGYSYSAEKNAENRKIRAEDNARRSYNRLFSTEKAGADNVTSGIGGAKRMYAAARVYQNYKDDKGVNRRKRAQELVDNGEAVDIQEGYRKLKHNFNSNGQIAKEEMLEQINEIFRKKDGTIHEGQVKNFWKMNGRLTDELESYGQFFETIDKKYADELEMAVESNNETVIKRINKEKEIALAHFHKIVSEQATPLISVPVRSEKPMPTINVVDRRFNTDRKINLSTSGSTQRSINTYMSAGVKSDSENKNQLKKERLIDMVNNMESQKIIGGAVANEMKDVIIGTDSAWSASHSLAKILSQTNGVELISEQEVEGVRSNPLIKDIHDTQQAIKKDVKKAIENAEGSAIDYSYNPTTKSATVKLSDAMTKYLDGIDRSVLSDIKPNNAEAIKSVIESIKRANPKKNVAVILNKQGNPSADFHIYDSEDGTHVQDSLIKGEVPTKSISFNMPLINSEGVIRAGDVVMNADRTAVYNPRNKEVSLISTVEKLADDIGYKIGKAMGIEEKTGSQTASKYLKRRVQDSLEKQSGINRNPSVQQVNDTNIYKGNTDDFLKQNRIRIENAMLQDIKANGYGAGNNRIELVDNDFGDSAFYMKDGVKTIKKNLSFDDLKPQKAIDVKMHHLDWANEKISPNLYANSVKSTHSGIMVSSLDIKDVQVLGNMYEQKRDNLIQMQNLHVMDADVESNINRINGASTSLSYVSQAHHNLMKEGYEINNLAEGNFAIMSNEQIQRRIEQMKGTEEGKKILINEGILNTDGSYNGLRMPTTYEQQGILAKELKSQMNYTQRKAYKGDVKLSDKYSHGSWIKPGDVFGYETLENGQVQELQYAGKNTGKISVNSEGHIDISWKENAFKYMMNGEKMTATSYSQKFIESLTGLKDIVGIYDSDVAKHGDFGQLAAGKIGLMTDAINQVPSNKRNQYVKILENAGIGFERDKDMNLFLDKTNEEGFFKTGDSLKDYTEKIYSAKESLEAAGLKIEWGNTLEEGNHVEKYRMQFGMAGVADYTNTTDFAGRKILRTIQPHTTEYEDHLKDKYGIKMEDLTPEKRSDLKPINVYENGVKEGVKVGHREMRVLSSMNMPETADYLYKEMIAQSAGIDRYSNITSLTRQQQGYVYSGIEEDMKENLNWNSEGFGDVLAKHMNSESRPFNDLDAIEGQYKQLSSITGDYKPKEGEKIYNHYDFKETPMMLNDTKLYEGTFMDMDKITSETGNKHGFWLQLPKVTDASGRETRVQIPMVNEQTKEVDKIFMPFTTESNFKGDKYLDEIQKLNSHILDAAAKVDNATNTENGLKAMEHLQKKVNEQTMMSVASLTSSKGLIGTNVMSARMSSSTTGLYKLVDERRSNIVREQYGMNGNTEFSAISEKKAKQMGIFDKLNKGEVVYGSHIRYPVFHEGAMQFNRIIMDSSLADNEIHTSDLSAVLKRADSDGDVGHLFTINDDAVQMEWKNYDEKRQDFFSNEIDKFKESVKGRYDYVENLKGEEGQVLRDMLSQDNHRALINGSAEEIAAKIGKVTIGQASNLNYAMQQIGAEQFADDEGMRKKIAQFGEGIEQKIISSKHGGKPIGLEFIKAIKDGNWDRAKEIDKQYFFDEKLGKGMFSGKYNLDDVAEVMPNAVENYDGGLRAKGLSIGTSGGLLGVTADEAKAIIDGDGSTQKMQTATNQIANVTRQILGIDELKKDVSQGESIAERFKEHNYDDTEYRRNVAAPNGTVPSGAQQRGNDASIPKKPMLERAKEKIPSSFKEAFNNIKESSKMKKAGIVGGLVGAGALAGSLLSNDDTPDMEPYRAEHSGGTHSDVKEENKKGANITVKARGQRGSADSSPSAVNQAVAESNMEPNKTNINVTTTDNSNKLNRLWYRDKVQENNQ